MTNKQCRPGDKLHRLVVEIRKRTYLKEVFNEETRMKETLIAGEGWEIVKELSCSAEGVELWQQAHPEGPEVVGSITRIG
jgi:hypothetical protein